MASAGEENSALYNLACCFAATGRLEDALDVVGAALDNGFEDLGALRSDPDLAPLRAGGQLEARLRAWEAPLARAARALAARERNKAGGAGEKKWVGW